jgi:uncharacterized membrane protein
MEILVLGLVLFLGVHSVRIVADDWRSARMAAWGEGRWKGLYSLASALGLGLIIWGYGLARQAPVQLWPSPVWTRHLAALLTLPAFVLLALSQVPGHSLKARLAHPMLLGVKLWAGAHLLANGTLADLTLFGSFLAWSVLDFRSARRRPVLAPVAAGSPTRTLLAVSLGLVAWAAFAFWGHSALIGVRPFG